MVNVRNGLIYGLFSGHFLWEFSCKYRNSESVGNKSFIKMPNSNRGTNLDRWKIVTQEEQIFGLVVRNSLHFFIHFKHIIFSIERA
jgi:hypothetical protein